MLAKKSGFYEFGYGNQLQPTSNRLLVSKICSRGHEPIKHPMT